MSIYKKTKPNQYTGRTSSQKLYLHEKLECIDFNDLVLKNSAKTFALLGYASDEGVKRNQGRSGAALGADAIREQLGKMANHLDDATQLVDVGTVQCPKDNLEESQDYLSNKVGELLTANAFPILLGGGHDIAYGHYNGIKKYLGPKKTIGIINFDAHFDLRDNLKGNNSGTPFYQIAEDCKLDRSAFYYLCLGIRHDANDSNVFKTAKELKVEFLENKLFTMRNAKTVVRQLLDFISKVDYVYVTIDLDGFSSAYAPGVSAASPMGFSPEIVIECLELIIKSKKMISLDIAEMNPNYDIDNQTAKLASSLVHYVMHQI
ncbi:MAG: formimidoylglutamase, partial [Flavobacteriaceae bacterium]